MLDSRDYYIDGIFCEGLYLQDLKNLKNRKQNTNLDFFIPDFEINDEEIMI